MGGIPVPDIDPFSVCQRQGGRRPDLIRRQRGDIDSRVKSGSAKWYKDGTVITSGQDSCTIGAASAKYALTVKANHMTVSAPQVRYTFEAIYIDANGLEIPFRAEVQFTQHLNAGR